MTTLQDFRVQHLRDSNEYHRQHGAEPLMLHSELNRSECAENLAKRDATEHRPNNPYGENIAAGYPLSNVDAVRNWYNEVCMYNFAAGQFNPATGHFTQLVWKESKYIGVGVARSESGMFYIVANYYPPGNHIGRFTQNVFSN